MSYKFRIFEFGVCVCSMRLNNKQLPQAHHVIEFASEQEVRTVKICRCWKSLKFPYCDDAHKQLLEHGENVGPFIARLEPHFPQNSALSNSQTARISKPTTASKVFTRSRSLLAVGTLAIGVLSLAVWKETNKLAVDQTRKSNVVRLL